MAVLELGIDSREAQEGARRFVQAANRATRAGKQLEQQNRTVAASFQAMRTAVFTLVGAIGAFGTYQLARQFAGIARGAIDAAAGFELLEIRLATLTGSAASAADVMEDVRRLAVETPFEVQGLTDAAAQMAIVFGNNTERIKEFTQVVANVAAVAQRDVRRVGVNVQRALSAGLGSSELLREAGISRLLADFAGVAEVAELRGQKLADAFVGLFLAADRFGESAKQLSFSVSGSMSNIEDASTEAFAALGEALEPVTLSVINDLIIPAWERLEEVIRQNGQTILDWAQYAVGAALEGLSKLLEGFEEWGTVIVTTTTIFTNLGRLVAAQFNAMSIIINGAIGIVSGAAAGLVEIAATIANLGAELGVVSEETALSVQRLAQGLGEFSADQFGDAKEDFEDIIDLIRNFSASIADAPGRNDAFKDFFKELNAELEDLITNYQNATQGARAFGDAGTKSAKDVAESTGNLADETETWDNAAQSAVGAVSGAFSAAAIRGQELDNVLVSLLQRFADIIAEALIFQPIANALTGEGGGFGNLFRGIASFFGFQHGGSHTAPRRGPDSQLVPLFLSPNETVSVSTPGQAAMAGGGGGSPIIEVYPPPETTTRVERTNVNGYERARIMMERVSRESIDETDGDSRNSIRMGFGIQPLGEPV